LEIGLDSDPPLNSNPSPFCAARGDQIVFSSSRQVISGDAALNEGDGLVAEIATSLPIAQSKRIE
jgi:hypothetical protein